MNFSWVSLSRTVSDKTASMHWFQTVLTGVGSLSSLWLICLWKLINAQLASMLMNVPTGPERNAGCIESPQLSVQESSCISICSKFSLNAKYRETRGANNIHLQCPHMKFYRKSLSSMGLTYGTNFPGLSHQSGLKKHLGRLFGSTCSILHKIYLCFAVLFFVTHPVLSYVLELVLCKLA